MMTKLGIDLSKTNERGETVLSEITADDVGAVADTPEARAELFASSEATSTIGAAVTEGVAPKANAADVYSKTAADSAIATAVADADVSIPTRRATLLDAGAADRLAASAGRNLEWDDTLSGIFKEEWVDLSAWSSSSFAQVSGGRLYSAAQAANSGASHAYVPGLTETIRAVWQVRTVHPQAGSGGVIVGFSDDSPGAWASGGGNMRGIYFRASDIASAYDGTFTSLATGYSGTMDWTVVGVADSEWVTFTARSSNDAIEVRARWPRAGWGINNLSVFNSDSRQLTGYSVGKVAVRKTAATLPPALSVDGVKWAVWTSRNGANMRVALPASYDSRKPSPVAFVFHGNGSDETHWWTNGNGKAVAEALLAAGYIVAGSAWGTGGPTATWGNDNSVTETNELYKYLRANFNIGPVVFYGNSMGSIVALNQLARDGVPGVRAYACTVPTWNLAENYANPLFTSVINGAYGSNYAANSVGHDPALMKPTAFRGIPVWMLVATDDAAVTPGPNGLAMAAALAKTNPVTKIETTGGHSTAQITANAGNIVAFFNAVLGR